MKKIATLAVLAITAISASAATINWGFGGDTWVSEDGTIAKKAANFTGDASSSLIALVYVGQNVSALTDDILTGVKDTDVVASATYKMGTTAKTANTWQLSGASPATVTSDNYSVGASFAVLFNNGTKWDYFYAVDTGSGAVGSAMKNNVLVMTDLSVNAQTQYVYGTHLTGSNVAAAVSVPEPSTAMLALAGLALLLKRRKA